MSAISPEGAPLVYVVVLDWNGWRDTVECVESLQLTDYPRQRIVVVDNASADGSEARIRAAHPDVTVLQSGSNLGYAGGNNVGIRHALEQGADAVWILNNDTRTAPDALGQLVAVAADPEIGIVGSKIYYMADPTCLWYAGGRIDWRRGISYNLGNGQQDTGQFDELAECELANGASMLVARRTFERVGLLDERYFLYFEEADFCWRTLKAGLRIHFAPRSHVWHHVSRSTGVLSPLFLYYFTRNNIQFVRAHRSPVGFLVSLPYLVKRSLRCLPATAGARSIQPRRLRLWCAAWRDGLFGRLGYREGLTST